MRGACRRTFACLFVSAVSAASASAADFKPINLHDDYSHDRFQTRVTGSAGKDDHIRRFRAYVSVFDGADDDDGDGKPDALGIPHFVAYEIKRFEGTLPKGPKRPSTWIQVRKHRSGYSSPRPLLPAAARLQ